MATMEQTLKKIAATYWKLSLWLLCGLSLICILLLRQLDMLDNVSSVVIAVIFNLLVSVAYGQCWLRVALKTPMFLPKFYIIASALRLFAAAAVVLIDCVIQRAHVEQVKAFAIIFLSYYILMLSFETLYFVRKTKTINLQAPNDKE